MIIVSLRYDGWWSFLLKPPPTPQRCRRRRGARLGLLFGRLGDGLRVGCRRRRRRVTCFRWLTFSQHGAGAGGSLERAAAACARRRSRMGRRERAVHDAAPTPQPVPPPQQVRARPLPVSPSRHGPGRSPLKSESESTAAPSSCGPPPDPWQQPASELVLMLMLFQVLAGPWPRDRLGARRDRFRLCSHARHRSSESFKVGSHQE